MKVTIKTIEGNKLTYKDIVTIANSININLKDKTLILFNQTSVMPVCSFVMRDIVWYKVEPNKD